MDRWIEKPEAEGAADVEGMISLAKSIMEAAAAKKN